jgi:hypothetical protein
LFIKKGKSLEVYIEREEVFYLGTQAETTRPDTGGKATDTYFLDFLAFLAIAGL